MEQSFRKEKPTKNNVSDVKLKQNKVLHVEEYYFI